MRVIYKLTGQTGNIPDDKYDPNLFDEVGATNVQAPNFPAAPPQSQRQPGISDVLSPVLQGAGKVADFLFPRTMQTVNNAPNTIQTAQQMGKYEQQNPAKDVSEWLGRQQGRMAVQGKATLPAAGEIAPWFMGIPGANRATTAMGRIGQRAEQGLLTGAARAGAGSTGAQDAIDSILLRGNPVEAIGNVIKAGSQSAPASLLSAIIGGGIQTGVEGTRAIANLLKEAGLSGMAGKIQPQTGSQPGFARREEAAAKQVLTKTNALTPRGIDKQIQDNLQTLNDAIQTKLAENPQPVVYSSGGTGAPDVQGKVLQDVTRSVSGFNPQDPVQTGYLQQALNFFSRKAQNITNVMNQGLPGNYSMTDPSGNLIEKSVSKFSSGNIAQQSITPLDIFKGKQDLGAWLGQNGVWNKLSKGVPLQQEEKIGLAVYNSAKEVIDETMGNNISDLTNAEHLLYQAGAGVYEMAHRGGSTNPSIFAVYKFPILGLIPNALDAISLLGNRAMWTVGQALQSGDKQMEALVAPLVNSIMGTMNGPKKNSQENPAQPSPWMDQESNPDLRIKAMQAQQAVDTADDPQGTYMRIVGSEPELSPYIHP